MSSEKAGLPKHQIQLDELFESPSWASCEFGPPRRTATEYENSCLGSHIALVETLRRCFRSLGLQSDGSQSDRWQKENPQTKSHIRIYIYIYAHNGAANQEK